MSDAVKWSAGWCWTGAQLGRPWNTYAYFRRTVELAGRPASAVVRVSADARYTLYVNGSRVHQGPARCYPQWQSYDTLDLAPYLIPGRNAICAIVHVFGVSNFQSIYRGAQGFILDGEIDIGGNKVALHTPTDWLCRPAGAWRKDVARLTIQLGFQEHFDAGADPAEWMSPQYEPADSDGWIAPKFTVPAHAHPWITMEPRGIPLLVDQEYEFAAVVAQFRGENGRGYKVAEDVYHFAAAETRKRDNELLEKLEAMIRRDDEVTIVHPAADGEFVAVTLDAGQYRTGHFQLEIAEAAGDEIIDILYAEELDAGKFPVIVGKTAEDASPSEICTADRYRCRPGAQRWEPFAYKGMRYVGLIFRNVQQPLKIRHVGVRQVQAGVEEIGEFECSDAKLNAIWRIGRETQRNCLFDALVDCPWREQAMWWGDARVQSRVTEYLFGDSSLLQRGIRLMARGQAVDGSLDSHPPSDTPGHRLPDFMMTWVGSLWDYFFQTGSTDLLKECLPNVLRLFEFFRIHEQPGGLIGDFAGWWVFLDWAPLYKENFSGVLNLMYLQALRHGAAICEMAGDAKSAAGLSARATRLTSAVVKHFWSESAKAWIDGYDPSAGKQVDEVSQHMNAVAMLLGLKKEARARLAKEILIKAARQRKEKIVPASPFFYAYVLEALFEAGFHEDGISIIRDKWGAMVDAGATTFWEIWEPTIESRCHAWSASPVYHLMQTILGVVPDEPGWQRVRIAPKPVGLEFARGVVPSPLGKIRVEWERSGEDQLAVRIELPAGMQADFIGPLGENRVLKPGMNEFHT